MVRQDLKLVPIHDRLKFGWPRTNVWVKQSEEKSIVCALAPHPRLIPRKKCESVVCFKPWANVREFASECSLHSDQIQPVIRVSLFFVPLLFAPVLD